MIAVGPAEYCHRDTFNATCETNEVVVMQTARFGRMSLGPLCEAGTSATSGAPWTSSNLLDSRCSGHSSCSMKIIDDALYQTHPCPDDTTAYLQASYSCIKGKQITYCQQRMPLCNVFSRVCLSVASFCSGYNFWTAALHFGMGGTPWPYLGQVWVSSSLVQGQSHVKKWLFTYLNLYVATGH